MIYDEIHIGDVLEWKLMANQSKMVVVTKIEEEIVYGSGKGKEKKWKLVGYVRGLYSFDEEPEKSNLSDIKQNCKRPKTFEPVVQTDDSTDENQDARITDAEPTFERDSEISYDDEFAQGEAAMYADPIYSDEDGEAKEAARQFEMSEKASSRERTTEAQPSKPQKTSAQLRTEEIHARAERQRSR